MVEVYRITTRCPGTSRVFDVAAPTLPPALLGRIGWRAGRSVPSATDAGAVRRRRADPRRGAVRASPNGPPVVVVVSDYLVGDLAARAPHHGRG